MIVSDTKPFPDLEAGLVEWAADHPALKASDPLLRYRHVGDELPSRYASE